MCVEKQFYNPIVGGWAHFQRTCGCGNRYQMEICMCKFSWKGDGRGYTLSMKCSNHLGKAVWVGRMPCVKLRKGETKHQCQGREGPQAMRNSGRNCDYSSREADLKKISCCCLSSNARWTIILKTDTFTGERTRSEMQQPRNDVIAEGIAKSWKHHFM